MPYLALTEAEIQAGEPVSQPLMQKIKDNFEDHEARLSGGTSQVGTIGEILNSSLEADGDSDGVPDNWTRYFYPGGTGGYDTSDYCHGTRSYRFNHNGGQNNGGGYLESDYVFVNYLFFKPLRFSYKCSVAGIRVDVVARYYDRNKTYLGEAILYSSTSNQVEWSLVVLTNISMAYPSAEYVKFRFVGGEPSVNVTGSVWFDAIGIEQNTAALSLSEIIDQQQVALYYYYYVDVGSVWNINIPVSGKVSWLIIGVECYTTWWDSGDYVYWGLARVRFRVGSRYSDEIQGNYSQNAWNGPYFPKMNIAGLSGPQQLRFQAMYAGSPQNFPYLRSLAATRKYYKPNIRTVDVTAGTVADNP